MNRLCMTGLALAGTMLASAGDAAAWGAHGHRVVTEIAMGVFSPDAPEWLRTDRAIERAAFQSNEADRWKGLPTHAINHENKPDHFIDIEHLWLMDMSFEELPRLRRDYLAQMAIARHLDPAASPGTWDAGRDAARAYEYPGFLPHAIIEHYEKLRSSFHTARAIERLDDPDLEAELEQARANAIYHMGMLSHFVGDGAQPLHVTEHFNGWVGDNPAGYTTDRGFHAAIDSGLVHEHGITTASATGGGQPESLPEIDPSDPWPAILAYLDGSFRLVEPLYAMEKSGALRDGAGKAFLEQRLRTGGWMLGALYAAAWDVSAPTEESMANFLKYDR